MPSLRDPTPLEYAILGLLAERPRTGYAVRKVFEKTPMGHYSSSPGSIYPALRRLEEKGLVETDSSEGWSSRRVRFFRPTGEGIAALKSWLKKPVGPNDVRDSMPELILRFAFMDRLTTVKDRKRFIASLARELDGYIRELESFLSDFPDQMSKQGMWAFENGLGVYRAHAAWTDEVLDRLGGTGR
jgi:DNA-binding PadR family transcriptional regulator